MEQTVFASQTLPSGYYDLVDNFSVEYKVNTADNPVYDLVHFHECFEIVLYVQSNNTIYIHDASYGLQTHDLIVIPPRTIHTVRYNTETTYCRYVLYFTEDYVRGALGAETAVEAFRNIQNYKMALTLDEFSRINALFKNITHHRTHHPETHAALVELYCSTILSEVYYVMQKRPMTEQVDGRASIVENILRYINEHYQENVLLEDMEKEMFLSRFYLSRVFAETMSTSIVEYLQFKRVIEAQKLLDDTKLPIIDICLECGFNNLQHFYRTFKKITSVTPKQFRDGSKISFTQTLKTHDRT